MNATREDITKWAVYAAVAVPVLSIGYLYLKVIREGRFQVHPVSDLINSFLHGSNHFHVF